MRGWSRGGETGCEEIPPLAPPPCPETAPHRVDAMTCIDCPAPYLTWNEETKQCDNVVIYGREYPEYSYVYTYENKTTTGNITYPEYTIVTTKHTGGEDYTEQDERTCPCDLTEFTTGETKMNEIIEKAVESAVEQQAKADYDFYEPLLVDPEAVPEVADATENFYSEQDDDGRAFINLDGTPMDVDVNEAEDYVYSTEAAAE